MDDEKLISAVQMRPCIFDKADKNRFNRDLIAAAWQNIAKEVGGDGEFISVITCLNTKNTHTPFRTQFSIFYTQPLLKLSANARA